MGTNPFKIARALKWDGTSGMKLEKESLRISYMFINTINNRKGVVGNKERKILPRLRASRTFNMAPAIE